MELFGDVFTKVSDDPRAATKHLINKLVTEIQPLVSSLGCKIQDFGENDAESSKIKEVYSLCLSQITKCLLNLFDIFRLEYSHCTVLQESRQCNLERLSWCLDRLNTIKQHLVKTEPSHNDSNESFNATTMHFLNWIDHAFENLNRLSDIIYKKDGNDEWKNELVECISGLHVSIDELLLCAMTLCRYSLPADQLVIKARSQVVLRETKALLSELLEGDVSSTIKATIETLKNPILPSNVNLTIDVLKDVLYVLETNTNTALLSLLIHCFSNDVSPVDVLKEHFVNGCVCSNDCEFVKEFDLYNERLLQIGSFAVSCSSDQNRILCLRSGLASLEALDPHIVPALMTSPASHHSTLLVKSWRQEVQEIRHTVFLIVDPAAFAEKSKQKMHEILLEVLKCDTYNNNHIQSVIRIGCVVHDFFNAYMEIEPDALAQREKLSPLLADLDKVQLECKIVSNLLCSADDYAYKIKMPTKNKTASLDQLYKRLKLLYTLVKRINSVLNPGENDHLFEEDEPKNVTHTVAKNGVGVTYVNSPRKNISRSMFGRTNIRSSTRNFPLSKLTKHLRLKTELNFSVKLDTFNLSSEKVNNKCLNKVKDLSAFNFSPIKNRSSLRKVVLNRHLQNPKSDVGSETAVEKESLFNEYESLQLTEVLNEINNMTSVLSTPKSRKGFNLPNRSNVLSINVNQTTTFKPVWNIPISSKTVDEPLLQDESFPNTSNLTAPSHVTTLERITDLDFVEDKLNSLKSQIETSL